MIGGGNVCADHDTGVWQGVPYSFGIHPDLSKGPLSLGCGGGSASTNTTAYASAELVNAITDPQIGLAAVLGPPVAWYDGVNGYEAASACNQNQDTIVGVGGVSYDINQYYAVVAGVAQCVTTNFQAKDFDISALSTNLKVLRTRSVKATLQLSATSGAPGPVSLAVSGLPAGITAKLATAQPLANSTTALTFKASAATVPGPYEVIVTATSGAAVHSLALLLTVK